MEEEDTYVYVYDRRQGAHPPCRIHLGGVFQFSHFRDLVKKDLDIGPKEKFIICTTSRVLINDDHSYEDLVNPDDTLYVLSHLHQELSAPASQRVEYVPHHDTIVKSGMYEYYASEGQNPLPYAFAELIDNSLSATHHVIDRQIEVQLVFDDSSGHSIIVLDNGSGMSTRKLNDWAIYRLSKQSRHHSDTSSPVLAGRAPRSLNSDISYFGVGGKQAIFFIGSAVRMITREVGSDDVHELFLSKDTFDQKARERQPVYTGEILNRQPGNSSHITQTGQSIDHLKKLIKSETERPHFTAVVITGVSPSHVQYLRYHFKHWCRQLAHIYHYYLHGPNGNMGNQEQPVTTSGKEAISKRGAAAQASLQEQLDNFEKIHISVSLYEKGKAMKHTNLSEVDDDLQTRFIRSSVSAFEFTAEVEGCGPVEGILRYHPFRYDHETFPQVEDPNDSDPEVDAENPGRPLFECYWNGRLIPYTTINSLEWCQAKRQRSANVPDECFRRISGVMWCDSHFQVSTNKLTFIDLPSRLQEKSTWYSRVSRGVEQRCPNMGRVFVEWLKESHELHDKQVKFKRYLQTIKRSDISQKRLQSPWAVFEAIEWDGKTFEKGQLVRIHRVIPVVLGCVKRFLLFSDHEEGEMFATGGEIEIVQEPASLYSETKVYPLSKLDRTCSKKAVEQLIAEEELKLPAKLDVTFPDGNSIKNNSKLSCDAILGAIGVEILNGHGDPMSKLVGERQKQLMVEERIVHHTHHGDKDIVKLCSRHGGKKWAYWFGAVEFRSTGNYTLHLQAVVGNDQGSSLPLASLPSIKLKFTVTEGSPVKFSVGVLDGPFRIGKPFQIPVSLHDRLENRTPLPPGVVPTLSASGMQVSFKEVVKKGGECVITGIVILGRVDSSNGKDVSLSVQIPSLDNAVQKMKIRLLPGPPSKLTVSPGEDGDSISVESGEAVEFKVQVQDAAGNLAADNRMNVSCKLSGAPNLEVLTATATNGSAVLKGVPNVIIKDKKVVSLKAVIDMPQHRNSVSSVERLVDIIASCRPAAIKVYRTTSSESSSPGHGADKVLVPADSEIGVQAGETLSDLTFQVVDEGGRSLDIDDRLAGQIRVNWVARSSREQIKNGVLPDVKVPGTVGESKFCQVSLAGQRPLDVSFTVEPLAGPAARMKCIITSPIVRVGEAVAAPLIITLQDEQGNTVKTVPAGSASDCKVTGANLKSFKPPEVEGSCIKIRNITFNSTTAGKEVVDVSLGDLAGQLTFQLIAATPNMVRILDWGPDESCTIYNNGRLPIPLVVQLFDEYGNACTLEGIKMQLGKSAGLKLSPPLQWKRTNAEGHVNFGYTAAQAERGSYKITPRAMVGQRTIDGPSVCVCVEPDPGKVVAVQVKPVDHPLCQADGTLPELVCYAIAEDGHAFVGAMPAHFKMELFSGKDMVSAFQPSPGLAGDESGFFYFRGKEAPKRAGVVQARFLYDEGSIVVQSTSIDIEVHPGPPCRLVSDNAPSAVAVSNSSTSNQRKIVENLELKLQDEHGNDCFDGALGGSMSISLSAKDSDPRTAKNVRDIPTFEGGVRHLAVPVRAGVCTIDSLRVAPECPGEDGLRYCVSFTLDCDYLRQARIVIHPFELFFIFCNDGHKQRQLSTLAKEKDQLQLVIHELSQSLERHDEELNQLRRALLRHEQERTDLQSKLVASGIASDQVAAFSRNPGAINQEISRLQHQCTALENGSRRRCMLENVPPHFANDREVVGKVAHLALIEDDAVARVLSWHMGNDMDCCITTSTTKAMSVNEQCSGRQQMLSLDSVYKRALPSWDKPLPHVRLDQEPRGNPRYVRDYLRFNAKEKECKEVFGLLLGEVIILDTLHDATWYRKQLAEHARCPTLLTREGDRIRSTGKFGGSQNKAPPLERLRVVFGSPPPMELAVLRRQVELLQTFCRAVTDVLTVQKQTKAKEAEAFSPDFKKHTTTLREKDEAMKGIDEKIHSLSTQPSPSPRSRGMAASSVAVTASSPTPKRARPNSGSASSVGASPALAPRPVRRSATQSPRESPQAKRRR